MGYQETLKLPLRVFWLMNSSVVRLMAEHDMRSLSIASASQAGEAIRQTREHLVVEMGEVVKLDPIAIAVRDTTGFEELRSMM